MDDDPLVFWKRMVIIYDNNKCDKEVDNKCDKEVTNVNVGDKKGGDSNDWHIFCCRAEQYLTKYRINYLT